MRIDWSELYLSSQHTAVLYYEPEKEQQTLVPSVMSKPHKKATTTWARLSLTEMLRCTSFEDVEQLF